MKKLFYVSIITVVALSATFASINLASMLGLSTYAAKKAIDIIDAVSTIATIISILAIVIGAGAVSTGVVIAAKAMIKKFGKKYAAAW